MTDREEKKRQKEWMGCGGREINEERERERKK